jgi:hypothetical protein
VPAITNRKSQQSLNDDVPEPISAIFGDFFKDQCGAVNNDEQINQSMAAAWKDIDENMTYMTTINNVKIP